MNIISFEYKSNEWWFHKVCFNKTNLIVGDSGTGKTRLLNTLFNLGVITARGEMGGDGEWIVEVEINKDKYKWNISKIREVNDVIIEKEQIIKNNEIILNREMENIYINDEKLPKLRRSEISVSILRDDDRFKPLYDGFSTMIRRRFFSDDLETNSATIALNPRFVKKFGENKSLHELYKLDLALNPRLYLLSVYFKEIYNKIRSYFLETFEFIEDVTIRDSSELFDFTLPGGNAPVFCIKEHSIDKLIPLNDLSSGMQKVLLILTDILSLPEESICLIDEYENSLGIGAIDFLPNILFSENINKQLFITSHHPYIINKFPIEDWCITRRKGKEVFFSFGNELVSRYTASKQDKYMQLINDPIYSEGVE